MADDASRDREAVSLSCGVKIGYERPAVYASALSLWVDDYTVHPGQIDDSSVVTDRISGITVPATTHRNLEAGRLSYTNRGCDILGRRALRDHAGRRLTAAFQTLRASSYFGSSGVTTEPAIFWRSDSMASLIALAMSDFSNHSGQLPPDCILD